MGLIHDWFGLTYSSYLVLPRLVLDSMPEIWQKKFIELLDEIEEIIEYPENYTGEYWVRLKKGNKFISDPLKDYRRGKVIKKIMESKMESEEW